MNVSNEWPQPSITISLGVQNCSLRNPMAGSALTATCEIRSPTWTGLTPCPPPALWRQGLAVDDPLTTPTLNRRNIKTVRHYNDPCLLGGADDLDRVLSRYGLIRVTNPGSVSWKFPANHPRAGVAAAELTCEAGDRQSFGFNEELALGDENRHAADSGLFRSAFRVIPVRPGTASFVDFRLVQDEARRHEGLAKMCGLMKLTPHEIDDDQFMATLRGL
jgi:hypothetical protein